MSSTHAVDGASSIIVVGSINVDLVFTGIARLPAPGETTTSTGFRVRAGGKGGNQAAAAARLGARTRLVGAVGRDDFGAQALDGLASYGVDTSFVRRVSEATGVASVLLDAAGENSIVVNPGANLCITVEDAAKDAAAIDDPYATVLLSLEVPIEVVAAWASIARTRGWRVILNPAPYPADGLPHDLVESCDVITPNAGEFAQMLAGARPNDFSPGARAIVVTRGALGAEVRLGDAAPVMVRAFPIAAADTTGAGDAFNGALAWAMGNGLDVAHAAEFACAAGALATRSVGARSSLPTASEVVSLMASASGAG